MLYDEFRTWTCHVVIRRYTKPNDDNENMSFILWEVCMHMVYILPSSVGARKIQNRKEGKGTLYDFRKLRGFEKLKY